MITVNGEKFNFVDFPDGTKLIRSFAINQAVHQYEIAWYFESEVELVYLQYIVRYIRSKGADSVQLYLPYIPNARMDRVKENDELFTLKYFCEIINDMKFAKVVVNDAHSNVALALLNNVVEEQPIVRYLALIRINYDYDLLMYPDAGAEKKYTYVIPKDTPYITADKVRDWRTGQITGLTIKDNGFDIKGKKILIVDDICSKGGTFYYAAKAAMEAGAREVRLWVTHCENTVFDGNLLKEDSPVTTIYTFEDILTQSHPKIRVFNEQYSIAKETDEYLVKNKAYNRIKDEYAKYGKTFIIACDFDNTLFDYHKKGNTYRKVIELMKWWQDNAKVVIWTGRHEEFQYDEVRQYLAQIGLTRIHGINEDTEEAKLNKSMYGGRKLFANIYLDDRAGLAETYDMLKRLKDEIEAANH